MVDRRPTSLTASSMSFVRGINQTYALPTQLLFHLSFYCIFFYKCFTLTYKKKPAITTYNKDSVMSFVALKK